MKLSDIKICDTELLRDNSFEAMGMINTQSSKKLLIFIESLAYIKFISENVSCIICTQEISKEISSDIGILISSNPKITFYKAHNLLVENINYKVQRFNTIIGTNCNINKLASISDNNVIIEDNVVIEEFVSIKENTIIGNNVIIRSGTVIGSEGFEFKRDKDEILPIKHLGSVIIESNVEIQHNCCIDKAVFPYDSTIIGSFTKIDNLIHIAHASKIGKRNLIAANTTICGSVTTGDEVWIGPNSIISNGLRICDNSRILIGAVILESINKEGEWIGYPACKINDFFKTQYKIKNLK